MSLRKSLHLFTVTFLVLSASNDCRMVESSENHGGRLKQTSGFTGTSSKRVITQDQACILNSLTASGANDTITGPLLYLVTSFLTRYLGDLNENVPKYGLTEEAATCLLDLTSTGLRLVNVSSTVSSFTKESLFRAVIRIGQGLLLGSGFKTLNSSLISLSTFSTKKGSLNVSGTSDFSSNLGSIYLEGNITDGRLTQGSNVSIIMYTFSGVDPLTTDSRVLGFIGGVTALYNNSIVDQEVRAKISILSNAGWTASVRSWNGSHWIHGTDFSTTSENYITGVSPNKTGSHVFAPYIEKIILPTLSRPDISLKEKSKSSYGPDKVSLILAVVLPPFFLTLIVVLVLLEARRRQLDEFEFSSSDSFSEDKSF